jgi:hypothetical protein
MKKDWLEELIKFLEELFGPHPKPQPTPAPTPPPVPPESPVPPYDMAQKLGHGHTGQGLVQGPHQAAPHEAESRALEIVTTCVGFADVLDHTLALNHGQSDNYIVVTTHADKNTQQVCKKHSVTCVPTDVFYKNGRKFNKGAAINIGFDYFQYFGWRLHLDVDIVLPDNFRRMLFNHSAIDPHCIYGADRIDVVGVEQLYKIINDSRRLPQHNFLSGLGVERYNKTLGVRFVDQLRGYCPIGYFQLWNASSHRPYPYSLGTAAHDDVMFAQGWSEGLRRVLPSVIVYHLLTHEGSYYGENWEGRRSPKFK